MSLCARLLIAALMIAGAGAIASQLSGLVGFGLGVGAKSLVLILLSPTREATPEEFGS